FATPFAVTGNDFELLDSSACFGIGDMAGERQGWHHDDFVLLTVGRYMNGAGVAPAILAREQFQFFFSRRRPPDHATVLLPCRAPSQGMAMVAPLLHAHGGSRDWHVGLINYLQPQYRGRPKDEFDRCQSGANIDLSVFGSEPFGTNGEIEAGRTQFGDEEIT